MTDSYWSGLGVAAGTTITTGNVNTTGNSDAGAHGHTVTYAVSGTPTNASFARPAAPAGPGLSLTAAAAVIARLDLNQVAARGGAAQIIYTPSAAGPTTSSSQILAGWSAAATAAAVVHNVTTNTLTLFNQVNATISGSATPALIANHSYLIDFMVDLNSGTPSTTNGRVVFGVKDLTDATWNTTGEFYLDTGYTVNVGTAQIAQWRTGKITSAAAVAQTYVTGIRWGERTALNTSTDPTTTKAQFIQVSSAVPSAWTEVRLFTR